MFNWDEKTVSALCELWKDGRSASQVAEQIGAPSRNAVLGKLHRLGMSGRPTTRKVKLRTPLRMKRIRDIKPKPHKNFNPNIHLAVLERMRETARTLPATVVGIDRFEPGCMCGYLMGEPADQARCGRPKVAGLPYCEPHAALCFAPPRVAAPYASTSARYGSTRDLQIIQNVADLLDA